MVRKIILNETEKNFVSKCVKENKSFVYIAKNLQYNNKTVRKLVKELFPDFKGNQSGKGSHKTNSLPYNWDDFLNNKISPSKMTKKRLFDNNVKEKRCERCHRTKWLGKDIPLELHHKDGNHFNNFLKNIEILCPNCHSFTDNYRGKNISQKQSNQ